MDTYNEDDESKKEEETPSEKALENQNEKLPNNAYAPKKRKKKTLKIISGFFFVLLIIFFSIPFIFKPRNTLDPCIASNNAEIYDFYKNCAVMVKHTYGIKVRIHGGKTIKLEDYHLEDCAIYASGFFVNVKGQIITNKHVVEVPSEFPENIQAEIKNIKIKLASRIPKNSDEEVDMEMLHHVLRGGTITITEPEVYDNDDDESLDSLLTDIEPTVVEYYSTEEIEIEPFSLAIEVMLHDTHEWLPAHEFKVAERGDIDLAIIQLNSRTTPASVTNFVNLTNRIFDDEAIKPGTKAIMIGFPMGMSLANTNQGTIKVQMYEGDINKESDGVKIQYSIPATQGASGAPVFDSCGKLIAVNFSGYDQQGFNFGIVAKHVQSLLDIPPPTTQTNAN